MTIRSHANAKKKTKRFKGFRFHSSFFSSDIMAVKGLSKGRYDYECLLLIIIILVKC